MKIKVQLEVNGNTQKFYMFLTVNDIIVQFESYAFIFCTFANSYSLKLVRICFHVFIRKPFNQQQTVFHKIFNKVW